MEILGKDYTDMKELCVCIGSDGLGSQYVYRLVFP